MSRQRPDPAETRAALGPLFEPRLRQLSHATDPHTSVKAASRAIASGQLTGDRLWALDLVRGRPGSTCPELAKYATYDADESTRQRIGRRLPELMRAGLIHRKGERDGCAIWFPGPDPEPGR